MAATEEELVNGRRNYMDPLVGFAFRVVIDGINAARFNNVDGLNYEAEMIEYRSSESPNVVHYRQGRRKPAHVTLKKGVLIDTTNNPLLDWIREVETGTISKHDVTIEIGGYGKVEDETSGGKRAWMLLGCMPSKWSLGSLDSNSNNALVETVELVVEEIRQ